MKAITFDGTTTGPLLEEVTLEAPRAGEVRVTVAAAGVCHSDLHVQRGEWEVPMPLVMGHEGSGVVSAVGEGVTSLEVGDHVVLSWVPSCGECTSCRRGRESSCLAAANTVAAQGVLFDGTSRLSRDGQPVHHYLGVSSFADEVVVPETGAIKVRKDAPLDTIAIVGCAVATGVGAVRNTADVEEGSTVAVIGCGGVGQNVVQGARLAGAARIVAIDLADDKLSLARRLGATDTINSTGIDAVAALKEVLPEGADYVFDAIGRVSTTEDAIAMLALGGAAVIVGLPPVGSQARFDPLSLAEADQRILGSNYGSVRAHRDIPALVDEYMAGELELDVLITARRPLSEGAAALQELAEGRAVRTLLVPSLG
ncbi:Zn-dependent alcohol dehydrogenase [Demequina zhanjiangensis]|uniref:Zn-dependent alcohol dehydrogenase n=1 Tax=Demequina zhanjiangensis TaxID=3051659 RepID=A0ABT8G4T1_9MICO|nr:Zn-dependent alcohol dehydrogenase [Demequina sp. SYSU T00b26]MDN4474155.1 Zn-dependent alcohol dehydrogenase [Demequina sp. SYSU T00b26]